MVITTPETMTGRKKVARKKETPLDLKTKQLCQE